MFCLTFIEAATLIHCLGLELGEAIFVNWAGETRFGCLVYWYL